ncbi:hypothetical protein LNQ03_22730 [Klebsiella pneumoniae subsp. pneumoniae]|nr:hypothetical protein [Klebsiella pneumoniae subsp. pneumoniae]
MGYAADEAKDGARRLNSIQQQRHDSVNYRSEYASAGWTVLLALTLSRARVRGARIPVNGHLWASLPLTSWPREK